MASGITIEPCVDEYIQKMLQPKAGDDRLKVVILCLNETLDKITVDKEHTRYMRDFEGHVEIFAEIMQLFREKQCCYAVYDCFYETTDCGGKEELVLISWCPEDASIKDKMLYSSSWQALKTKFNGIKHTWQLCDNSDKDCHDLVDKFGTKGCVAKLEGKPIH